MLRFLFRIFRRRRSYDYRAPYDTGITPEPYGINWEAMRARDVNERRQDAAREM
jgi:hypothetical protein